MTMAEFIPSPPTMGRSIIDHDPRNRNYPARALFAAGLPRKHRTWRRGNAYDQGPTSSCVGQTFKGVLNSQLLSANVAWRIRSKLDAINIYRGGQQFDEWPGDNYDGTSARGACRYLQSKGLISEYRWCFGLDDVLDTLSHHGPVAIGIAWHSGMWNTDYFGFLHPTGSVVGGHEVELHGINVQLKYVIGTNSWGTGWGINGRFKISWPDLNTLLQDDGDAVTILT
jgi:hypothetical protein